MQKQITPFYHAPTNSWSYLLADPASKVCAFIDPVLDFEPGAGTTSSEVDAAKEYFFPPIPDEPKEAEGFCCCCEPDPLPRRCFRPVAFVGVLSANSKGIVYNIDWRERSYYQYLR